MSKKIAPLSFSVDDDEKAEEQATPRRRLAPARLPEDLIEAAKIYAVKNKTTFQQLVEEGLRQRINF